MSGRTVIRTVQGESARIWWGLSHVGATFKDHMWPRSDPSW